MKTLKKPSSTYTLKLPANVDGDLTINNSKGQEVFRCYFYGIPACCGVVELAEIGSLSSDVGLKKDKGFTTMLDSGLHQLLEISHNGGSAPNECKVLLANLINNEACNLLKDAFIRTKTFTNYKTFVNSNSGNEITMWVSNN